jgi:hypothetical protein
MMIEDNFTPPSERFAVTTNNVFEEEDVNSMHQT